MSSSNGVKVSVLLGIDYLHSLIKEDTLPIRHNGLVATPTLVGWIISGSLSATHSSSEIESNLFPTTCINISEVQVSSWWDLEAVGVRPDETNNSVNEDPILIQFYQQLEYS